MSNSISYELFVKNPLNDSNFPFLILDCNNHQSFPPRLRYHDMHWHDDLQIIYVIEGQVKIRLINRIEIAKTGEIGFINKHILHQIEEVETSHYQSFIFPQSMIMFYYHSPMNDQFNDFLNNTHNDYILMNNQESIEIIKNISEVYYKQKEYKEYHITSLLIQFIYQLLIHNHQVYSSNDTSQYLIIQKCIVFIHQHYQEDISLQDIADYGNISVGYLGKLFLKTLEMTPYEYLINYRIKKSLELMTIDHKTITQIALEVGFNEVSYYIQVFKKKMNITPKQYQKQLFITGNNNYYDI